MMRRALLLSSILCASIGAAGFAQAQDPVSALRGHDSNADIYVDSQRIEVQDRADRAIFVGSVRVRQAALTLETERLTVAYSSTGGIDIDRLDASGGVVVRSPSETARGDFGIYDLDRRLITLVGNVRLARQGSEINGSRLVIDLSTGRAVIDGGPPGVDQQGGRVTGRFTVPRRGN